MTLKDCAAFVGIDWAEEKHAVCLIEPHRQTPELDSLDQDPHAIDEWVARLQERFPDRKIAVCLEQKRGALIYALMKFDCLILVPINPKQLARFREALSPSGAKDDPTDARALAELLVKHQDRLRAWQPDDESTRKIRLLAEDRRHLVDQRTALTNELKSRLKQYFPLALQVIGSRLHGDLACQFLLCYPSLEKLQAASDEQIVQFYRDHHSYRQQLNDERLQRIRQAKPLTTDAAILDSSRLIVCTLVEQIIVLNQAIEKYDLQLASEMRAHPDAELFEAFPGDYDMLRAKGSKHQAAVRSLAFKWIRVIFRCWKNRILYNELTYTAALIQRQSPIVKFLANNSN